MNKTRVVVSILVSGISLALTYGTAFARTPKDADAAHKKQETPFACDRLALDTQTRRRHFEDLGPALRSLRKAVRELPDGYEFEFPSDPQTVAMVLEWVSGERLCCPFFDIQVRLEREHGPLWLSLTGREGTKEFIKVDGASWLKPAH